MRIQHGWVLVCVGLLAAGPSWGKGADFVVNSQDIDSDVGGCENAPGDCTLPEAIEAVNAKGSGSIGFDPTLFPPGSSTPISLSGPLPPIQASKVRVDGSGAGVEIEAESAGTGNPGLLVQSGAGTPLSDVQIRNLEIRAAPSAGLAICGGLWPDCEEPLSKVRVESVYSHHNGAETTNSRDGIYIAGAAITKTTVVDCIATRNPGDGIRVDADADLSNTTLMGNTAIRNEIGIFVTSTATAKLKVLDNHASDNFAGIGVQSEQLNGLVVADNHTIANETIGMDLSLGDATKVTIADNTAIGNEGMVFTAALQLSAENLSKLKFERNVTDRNGSDTDAIKGAAIFVGGTLSKANFSRNQASGNSHDGIQIETLGATTSFVIERNVANGNADVGLHLKPGPGSSKIKISKNVLDANAEAGLMVDGPGSTVEGNTANGNLDGIFLVDDADGTLIQKNVTDGNRQAGIYVDSTVTGATIQRNRARGNAWASGAEEDLFDDSGDCLNNTWKQNDFGSNDPACIE